MTDETKKIRDLANKARVAAFTTLTDEGALGSRPMTPQNIEDDWTIIFITQRTTDVALQSDGKPVNLAFVDGMDFVSIAGTGEIRDDLELKRELWNTANEAFTEGGPENPDNVILAVRCETARYWDSPAAPVALVSMLKAAVTGEQARPGDTGSVELQ